MKNPHKCLPVALAALTLLLTGCPHNEYIVQLQPQGSHLERTLVFYCADGVNSNGIPQYASFNTNELAAITALYPASSRTNESDRHQVQGEFTNQMPDDVGGAGTYANLSTSLGEAGFYLERFRGNDDLAGMTQLRFQAADRVTDLFLGWSRMTLGREKGYDQLRHSLDVDFRHDLKNLDLYWWQGQFANHCQTNSDHEFYARMLQYLLERGYFTLGEFPALFNSMADNDTQPMYHHLQRLVARKLGVPDTAPVPASLAFLTDETTMQQSFAKYLATTDLYRAKLKQWKKDRKLKPDLKQPEPDDAGGDAIRNLLELTSFDQNDRLTVRLSLPAPPIYSNGRWDAALRQVVWDGPIGDRTQTNPLPFTCYATWAKPDETFQTEHLGQVALTGDNLIAYALWRSGQNVPCGAEWDAFLTTLQPGPDLTSRLAAFRFPGEPPPAGTNQPPNIPIPSAYVRDLLKNALQ